ncbi:MAG: hypothetical protein JWM69_1809 [Candidatus Binatus sp.]|jgi:hemerythrin-like domain-containing protein|nr:hypothetical protein [Candidatus Binatus sp.]
MAIITSRRKFVFGAAIAAGYATIGRGYALAADEKDKDKDVEVSANEDLMREHGVLRRSLLIFYLSASKLRKNPQSVPPDALNKTAHLFRTFGEDYHERALEEPYIFPAVKKVGGKAGQYVDVLIEQHNRGREITDYILSSTSGQKLDPARADELARTMDGFVLMYQEHTAREDTVVFPAWHKSLSEHGYEEMGEKFEAIEHKQFGKDGFEDAADQVTHIEESLGLADLAQFTAPPPPK